MGDTERQRTGMEEKGVVWMEIGRLGRFGGVWWRFGGDLGWFLKGICLRLESVKSDEKKTF